MHCHSSNLYRTFFWHKVSDPGMNKVQYIILESLLVYFPKRYVFLLYVGSQKDSKTKKINDIFYEPSKHEITGSFCCFSILLVISERQIPLGYQCNSNFSLLILIRHNRYLFVFSYLCKFLKELSLDDIIPWTLNS